MITGIKTARIGGKVQGIRSRGSEVGGQASGLRIKGKGARYKEIGKGIEDRG